MDIATNQRLHLTRQGSRSQDGRIGDNSLSKVQQRAAKAVEANCFCFRLVLPAAVVLLTAAHVSGQSYTVVDLGTLNGGSSYAKGINNAGRVVGE